MSNNQNKNTDSDVKAELTTEQKFRLECAPINQDKEYGPVHLGPKWLIASDLTKEEIEKKYPEQIQRYGDYLLVPSGVGRVILGSNWRMKNAARKAKKHEVRYEEYTSETFHPELSCSDYLTKLDLEDTQDTIRAAVYEAIQILTPPQRNRILKRFIDNKTFQEIAEEEGVSHVTVIDSVKSGFEKMRAYLKENLDESALQYLYREVI